MFGGLIPLLGGLLRYVVKRDFVEFLFSIDS